LRREKILQKKIKHWKRYDSDVGKTVLHPGYRNEYEFLEGKKFGKIIEDSDHVDKCLPQLGVKGFDKLIHENNENIYKSVKEEPLGKTKNVPMI